MIRIKSDNIDQKDLKTASEQLWKVLVPHIEYLSKEDKEVVELAFDQMVEAHKEQRRKSGDFYILHPTQATLYLAEMKLDRDTLAATLLHDVPEDTGIGLRDLEKVFDREIIFLISGITKLSVIKYQKEHRYAENLRRMFVAMSKDLRVIFIKLADRLHNLQTLEFVPEEKAQRIALESLEIYAPIAERLGMGFFQQEIEDTAFAYAYPEEYADLLATAEIQYEKRMKYVSQVEKKVKGILEKEGVEYVKIYGRAKRYYSLFRKMKNQHKSVEEINDLVALRVITKTVGQCYEVLGMVNGAFETVDGTVKDYINKPKPNGYQSLHTTLIDRQYSITFEVQIRTQDMHEFAEYGVAAHWAYKRSAKSLEGFVNTERLKWINELIDLGRQELSDEEYVKYVRLDLFRDRIFVMTPKGDVIDLPEGASPLDFAFHIHQEIGRHATMAKVNGIPLKLADSLHNGDVVEIITDKRKFPSRDWLQWVKTGIAARSIRQHLRKQGVDI
jgi:GTP pyrophosphokinase